MRMTRGTSFTNTTLGRLPISKELGKSQTQVYTTHRHSYIVKTIKKFVAVT